MTAERTCRFFTCTRLWGGWLLLATVSAGAGDWPQYRGPTHDGVSTERINKQWTGSVTNAVWRVHLTNGLTSLTIGGGRVFTQIGGDIVTDIIPYEQPRKDFCLALNATNGAILWSTEIESSATPLYPDSGVGYTDDGPRSTPALSGDSVYVLSSYLKLYRLNRTNGTVIWSTNLVDGFGGNVIAWQNAASPVIENGLVFVNANSPTASLMAFNVTNGALVWRSKNEGMTHSTPILATIHGTRQLIWATQSGLVAVNPQTGALLWKSPYPFGYSTSIGASPVVHQDYVFITANYGMSAYTVQIVLTGAEQVPVPRWTNSTHRSHWSTPVAHAGYLYGMFYPDSANAELRCIELASGAARWTAAGFGRGGILLVGTNLLLATERGDLVLAAASPDAYTELGRFAAIPNYLDTANKCWNAPALSDGQVYVRSTAYAARFDLSVPDLVLDPPQLAAQHKVSLLIRTVTGDPISSNRVTGMELRAGSNAGLPPTLWQKLNQPLMISNGLVWVTNIDGSAPHQLFIVSEPP